MVVPAALGIPAAMGFVIHRFAKVYVDIRKTWYEGNLAAEQARKTALEAERIRRDLQEHEEQERSRGVRPPDLTAVSGHSRQEIEVLVVELLTMLKHSPNITVVKFNDVTVLDRHTVE